MNLIAVGTSHKYSPTAFREKICFSRNRANDALLLLKELTGFKAAVILSTCNRVEIYAAADDPQAGIGEITDFICRYHEVEKSEVSAYLYKYDGEQAFRHLLLVASGLDSLITGETQILGQVKSAFLEAERSGFMDAYLKEVFREVIITAGQIHRDTQISRGRASVGSIAIDFIKQRLGSLSGRNILIIGVGKVTELVLKYLIEESPNVIFVSNRTFEKAEELAARISARAIRFSDLNKFLKKADVVITATSSPHFIIKRQALEAIMPLGRRLLIVDLALPRDVEPQAGEMANIDLFGLEDLGSAIKNNMERKKQAAEKAIGIIDRETERLWEKFTESGQEAALLP